MKFISKVICVVFILITFCFFIANTTGVERSNETVEESNEGKPSLPNNKNDCVKQNGTWRVKDKKCEIPKNKAAKSVIVN